MPLMPSDLQAAMPLILPRAIAWAEAQSLVIARSGQALDDVLRPVARRVGVAHPERIHVLEVPALPLPEDPVLRQAALDTGLLGPGTIGLTLGRGIFIRSGHASIRLLSHEFRHVQQYERLGSISAFLTLYLQQIAAFGYDNAPLELDARAHEIRLFDQ